MKRPRRNLILLTVAVALAAAVVARALSAASWRDRRWDTLELSLGDNLTTLDPALIKDVAGGRLAALIYPNLVRYGEDEDLTGDAAESWTVSDDARVYTFHMRPDACFADGAPMSSLDVKASFERTLAPAVASPRAWVLLPIANAAAFHEGRAGSVSGIETPDGRTVRLTLERPSGTFLALLTMPAAAILPASTPRRAFWGVETLPAAGGPFRVARLDPDVAITLEASPHYYGTRPLLAGIRYRIIRNPFATVTEFRQGRLDVIDVPDSFDRFFRGDAARQPFVDSVAGQNTFYLGFNCTRAPFDSRAFRRAAARSIDRQAIIDGVLGGRATAAAGPIPPGVTGYDPGLAGLGFDRAAAKAELARLGGGARPLTLLVLSGGDSVVVAQALAGQLSTAGLSIEVAPRERGTFKSLLSQGDFDMVYYSWVADYPDGENFLVPLFATAADRSGGNYTAYSSPPVDVVLARAAVTPDQAARIALYREAARTVVEDAPRTFLWHAKRVTVRQPWVRGFRLQHVYNAQRFTEVTIERQGL